MNMIQLVENEVKVLRERLTKYEIALAVLIEMEAIPKAPKKPGRKKDRKPRADRSAERKKVVQFLLEAPAPQPFAAIAQYLNMESPDDRDALLKIVSNMYREGRLKRNADRCYSAAEDTRVAA